MGMCMYGVPLFKVVDIRYTFISRSVLGCRPVCSVRHSHWMTSVISLKSSVPLRSVR